MTDTTSSDMLTAKQHKAISGLLSEPTIKQAADVAGVAERTLHTYLRDPSFQDAYRTARREAVRQAIARLQRGSAQAVTVLVDIMNNTSAKHSDRIAAASKILDTSIKAVELEDLASRVDLLEKIYDAKS